MTFSFGDYTSSGGLTTRVSSKKKLLVSVIVFITEPGDHWCLGFSGFESGFSSPVTEEFWQWVGAEVSGSIQVSSKEIASVGHEAEFWS